MGNQFSRLSRFGWVGVALVTGMSVSITADGAVAQSAPPTPETSEMLAARDGDEPYRRSPEVRPLPTIPEAFNRAYYSNSGNFFDNRPIWQGFRLIFGVPNYVERAIEKDGRAVNRLYREVLEQQVSSGPVLRSPDLPNPYTGSILTTPLVISEDPITPIPPFPSVRRRGPVEPAPVAPDSPRQPEPAVPALW